MIINTHITITRILIITLVVVTSLIMTAFGAFNYYHDYKSRIHDLQGKLNSITTQLSAALVNPLWTFNDIDTANILESFMMDKEVYVVFVEGDKHITGRKKDKNGISIPLESREFPRGNFYSESNILFKGEKIGLLGVCLTDQFMKKELQASLFSLLSSIFALNVALVSISFVVLMKTVFTPLKIIEDYAIRMSAYSGIEDTHIQGHGFARELMNLKNSIENMIHQLKNRYLELQRSQTALKETEKKYRDIFDNASEGIFQSSRNGRLITANQALATIMGYDSAQDILNSNSNANNDFFVESSKRKELFDILNSSSQVSNFEAAVFRKDKSVISVSITAHAIFDDHKNLIYYEGMLQDITQKKITEELKIAKEAAEATTKAKSVFLASMSHEIRTPISAIIGLTELASRTELTEKQQDYLAKIGSSASDLLCIISDILDFSKIEAGELNMEYVAFPLAFIWESIADIFSQKIADKGLELRFVIDDDVPSILIGDPLRIRQILINLTGNAVKFTEKGEIVISSGVEMIEHDRVRLKFSVKDTGIGIRKEKLTSIFSPFTQVEPFITRRYGGTGLGLSICRQLVEMMDGEIWAESEVGKGTRFIFTAGFGFQPEAEIENFVRPDLIRGTVANNNSLKGARVLLVEDNAINRMVAVESLEGLGMIVESAVNGLEAVKKFSANAHDDPLQFDAVLMDVQMPEMNGFEATMRIRQIESMKAEDRASIAPSRLPIIAMTAHAMLGDREKCIESGMDDYITKPIDSNRLFVALKKWIPTANNKAAAREKGIEAEGQIREEQQEKNGDYELSELFGVRECQGLNLSRGIKRLNGNKKLYLRILGEFAGSHGEDIQKIQQSLAKGDLQLAQMQVHTLKGVVRSIAADQLAAVVENVEEKIKKGETLNDSTFVDAQKMISVVLDSISKIKNGQEAEHEETSSEESSSDIGVITPAIIEMYQLLKNNRIDADKYSDILKRYLLHAGLEALAVELDTSIGQFDFKGTRTVVEKIARHLHISLERKDS